MPNNLKLLKTFNSRLDADLLKSFLESNGIQSIIISDDAGEMYPSASLYWGVKLFVREVDYETAYKLINLEDEND